MSDIDNLFIGRQAPWPSPPLTTFTPRTTAKLLKQVSLDWTVERLALHLPDGTVIPDRYANVRSTDNAILGLVGRKYHIVQNHEAMAFFDALVAKHDWTLITAGQMREGQVVWALSQACEFEAGGETYANNLIAVNAHNGLGTLQMSICPLRVNSKTPVNIPFKTVARVKKLDHVASVADRLSEAGYALTLAKEYQEAFQDAAKKLLAHKTTPATMEYIIERVFPLKGENRRAVTLQGRYGDEFRYRYHKAPDLEAFRGTAWGLLLAMADFAYHRNRFETKHNDDAPMLAALNGEPWLDRTFQLLEEMV